MLPYLKRSSITTPFIAKTFNCTIDLPILSIKAVKDKVIGLSKDIKLLKEKGQIALTQRQMKVVERIIAKGTITNREMREIFGLSDEGVRKEISKLIELRVVKRKGKGRSLHYVLV
jgi:predicted HTH transcriptional regulator